MNYLIGVDVGTSATKTVLFDEDGAVAASASREYPLYQPENGWAEQRPEDWRDAVLATLKAVTEQSGVPAEDITSHSLSEVALNNGFPNGRAFSKAFVKRYGCLPSEYRKVMDGDG